MAQQVTKYRILLSSPSDVQAERDSLHEVISELNRTYSSRKGVILELIGWETHAAPGASSNDVQSLIDHDLGEDYDLFIGIIWKRFGTRTALYGSGTEQEFMNAYQRFQRNPDSLQILFYFCKSPFTMDDIDVEQITKVKGFKEGLGTKEILYWDYSSVEQLHQFLRMHIPMRIDKLLEKQGNFPVRTERQDLIVVSPFSEEELGILDLAETIEDAMTDATDTLSRIAGAIEWVGKEINLKTEELNRLASGKQAVGNKELRKFYSRTATIMDDFSNRLAPDVPILLRHFEVASDAMTSMVEIQRMDFDGVSNDSVQGAADSLLTMNDSIANGMISMNSFLDSVVRLPRVSKELNRARRNVESVLTDLILKMEVMHSLITEVHRNMAAIDNEEI